MSTSGNLGGQYGQRQSWRRGETSQTGKRRTAKIILTVIALLLTALFLYLILRPTPKRRLQTIVVSNPYDIDIVTPPLFGATARKGLQDQLAAKVLFGDSQQIRSAFGQSELISEPLTDVDDTVMVVLRGYLMLNSENQPALACSDLSVRMPAVTDSTSGSDDANQIAAKPLVEGLVPISEILKPLATEMPDSFRGVRLLVLDIEPLAAHPTLNQWNETVFASLEQTVRQIESPFADRVWVICTRGPLQNVGWDAKSTMPISTQTLLDGLDGAADLDKDHVIELDELCAFMADRYEQLRHSSSTEIPRLMVMQAGKGVVDAQVAASGDMDLWLAYAPPPEKDEQTEEADEEPEETESAEKSVALASGVQVNTVALQTAGTTESQPTDSDADNNKSPTSDASSDADGSETATPDTNAGDPARTAPNKRSPTEASLADDANAKFPTSSFWDFRDQFEAIETSNEGTQQSAIALAPHLWRQMVLKVLGNEIRNYDPESSNQVPDQVAEDLQRLQDWLGDASSGTRPSINDDVVTKLVGIASQLRDQRRGQRVDRRVRTADALQHAIAVGRARLWSWIEYQRQAALGGQPIAKPRLVSTVLAAERLLASGKGDQTPGQVSMDSQLSDLKTAIELFDRGNEAAVISLINDFSRADPSLTWELDLAAWAWLRSPLPTGDQRRRLLAAIQSAPVDETDTDEREIAIERLRFATARGSTSVDQDLANLRNSVADFNQTLTNEYGRPSQWYAALQTIAESDTDFADQFTAAIRIDPRWKLTTINQLPIAHAITALPLVRKPSVTLLGAQQRPLTKSDSLRFETMQDVQNVIVNLRPDQPRPTRFLVSYQIRSASGVMRDPPVDVRWKVPGYADAGSGDPVSIPINPDDEYDLALEVRAADFAATGENLSIEIQVRGDRQADDIKGVTGTYTLPIELPRRNQLRLIASAYGGIGCSKPVTSGEGGLSRGIWLRTFNSRPTPFQLQIFNESGKPCRAKMWLIKLPNPMPQYAGYWPEFAAGKITNPDGGVLDGDGRILKRFLRNEDVLLGPATMAIPGDRNAVPLNFKPPPPAEGDAATPASADRPNRDVTHAMALVCRLVDPDGNPLPSDDQIVYLAAKPWAPRDYVRAKAEFANGKVEVNAELNQMIDGDQIRDEIPGIESRPVTVIWKPDDQWASFEPESQTEPVGQDIRLTKQSGAVREFIQVEVPARRNQTWVRLDVDGWPRSIWQTVAHQSGASGRERIQSRVAFSELTLTRRPVGKTIPTPDEFFFPRGEVYFKGGGQRLMTHLHADFAVGANNRNAQPMVQLQVDGRPVANYRTDRTIKTELTELTEEGVITLLTTVGDLEIPVSRGQSADDRVELTAKIVVDKETEDADTITAVLDSKPPDSDSIEIEPRMRGPYYAPGAMRFSIGASDPGAAASGIAKIAYGLDSTGDGKFDTQRRIKEFDPPVVGTAAVVPADETNFKFAVPQIYGIVVQAIDAAGNTSSERRVIEYIKKQPKPKPATIDKSSPAMTGPPKPLYGRVHGQFDTRAGISGTLSISPSPKPMRKGTEKKSIVGQDRSFDFGPLPDGEYTLKFKGAINNKTASLTWEGIKPDMTRGRTKPLDLDPADGK